MTDAMTSASKRDLACKILAHSNDVGVFSQFIEKYNITREDICHKKQRFSPTILEVVCSFGYIELFDHLVKRFNITIAEIVANDNICLDISLYNNKIDVAMYIINELGATAEHLSDRHRVNLYKAFDECASAKALSEWARSRRFDSELQRPITLDMIDYDREIGDLVMDLERQFSDDLGPKFAAQGMI
jgi:hypothetical protein